MVTAGNSARKTEWKTLDMRGEKTERKRKREKGNGKNSCYALNTSHTSQLNAWKWLTVPKNIVCNSLINMQFPINFNCPNLKEAVKNKKKKVWCVMITSIHFFLAASFLQNVRTLSNFRFFYLVCINYWRKWTLTWVILKAQTDVKRYQLQQCGETVTAWGDGYRRAGETVTIWGDGYSHARETVTAMLERQLQHGETVSMERQLQLCWRDSYGRCRCFMKNCFLGAGKIIHW